MERFLRIVLSCRSRKARGTQPERKSVPEQYIVAVRRQLDKEESCVSAGKWRMASEMKVKQPRRRRSTAKYVRSPPKKPLPTISESEDHRSLRSYYVQHQANGNQIVSVPADRGSFFSGEGLSFPVCLAVYDVPAAGKSGPSEDKPTDDGHDEQARIIEEDNLAIAGEALCEALAGSDDEGHGRPNADKPGGSRRTARPKKDELLDMGRLLSTPVKTDRRSSQRDAADSSPTLATPEQADHVLTRTSSSDSFVTAASDTLTEVSADSSTSSSAMRACSSKSAPDTRAEKAAASECRSLSAAKCKKFTVDSAQDIDFEIASAKRKQANDVSFATKPELALAEQEPPSTPVAQQASSHFITHHNPAFSPDPQDGSAAWEYPANRLPKSIRTVAGKSAIAEVIFGDSARGAAAVSSLAFAFHTLPGTSGQSTPQACPETPYGSKAQLDSAYRSPFIHTLSPRPQQPAPGSPPQTAVQHAQATLDGPSGRRPNPSAQNGSASPLGFHFRLKPESPLRAQPQQQTSQLGLGCPSLADSAEQGDNLDGALLVSQNISLQDLVLGPRREEQVASHFQGKVQEDDNDAPLAVACHAADEGEPSRPPRTAPARAQGSSAAEVVLLSPTVDQLAREIRRRQDTLEQLILFYDSWVDRLGCADLRVDPVSPQQASRTASSALTSTQPSFTSSQLAMLDSRPPSVCSGGRSPRVEASDLSSSSAFSELSGHSGPRSPTWGPERSSSKTVVLQGGGLFRGSVGIAGKPHGLGRFQSVRVSGNKTGDLYQGEFADGLMHGLGVYDFGGCGWYSGQWVQGRQQGYGKQIFANGTMCLGSFGRTGRLDGFGVCLYPSGDSYEGQFRDGVPHGHGYHKAANKGAYAGSFYDGRRCGIGVYRFANGDTFSGTFEADHPSGHGIYTTKLREHLEGEFHDGQVHGWGVRILPDGAMAAGKWERGRLQWSRSLQARACVDGLPDLDAEGMDLAQETARGARHSAALAERAARAARRSTHVMDAVRLAMEAARLADTASKRGARIASK